MCVGGGGGFNAFTTGNPFFWTDYLAFVYGDFGALQRLVSGVSKRNALFWAMKEYQHNSQHNRRGGGSWGSKSEIGFFGMREPGAGGRRGVA